MFNIICSLRGGFILDWRHFCIVLLVEQKFKICSPFCLSCSPLLLPLSPAVLLVPKVLPVLNEFEQIQNHFLHHHPRPLLQILGVLHVVHERVKKHGILGVHPEDGVVHLRAVDVVQVVVEGEQRDGHQVGNPGHHLVDARVDLAVGPGQRILYRDLRISDSLADVVPLHLAAESFLLGLVKANQGVLEVASKIQSRGLDNQGRAVIRLLQVRKDGFYIIKSFSVSSQF